MRESNEDDLKLGLAALGNEVRVQGDLERVRHRAARIGHRQTIRYVVVAVAVLVAATTGAFALRGDGTTAERAIAGAECDVVNDGVPTFPQFAEGETPHGRPGDRIDVSGSGFYAPAKRVDVLWNEMQDGLSDGPAKRPGPSFRAARGDVEFGCRFQVDFAVPDVAPGEYSVIVRVYDPESRFAVASESAFAVTP